jgi:hypothetical protein
LTVVREARIVANGGADRHLTKKGGMAMERFFEHTSTVVRNERIKLAALFWTTTGAGLFVGAVAGAFFVRANFWPKFGIGLAGFVLGMLLLLARLPHSDLSARRKAGG